MSIFRGQEIHFDPRQKQTYYIRSSPCKEENMTPFTGMHHIALATADMDQTIRYWRDLLGARLVAGLGKPGARQYFFEIAPQAYVGFFEWPEVRPVPEKDHGMPVKGPFGFDHLSLALTDHEALWTVRERLLKAGYWVSEAMDHGFIHSIYTFDPNNIPLEFSVPTGMDVSAKPVMLDRHPSEITLEGPNPQPDKWGAPTRELNNRLRDREIYPGEGAELRNPEQSNWFLPP
jgi:catechol 2,3-dioxygenase-like lactoylglutathione lyase family enzyme